MKNNWIITLVQEVHTNVAFVAFSELYNVRTMYVVNYNSKLLVQSPKGQQIIVLQWGVQGWTILFP